MERFGKPRRDINEYAIAIRNPHRLCGSQRFGLFVELARFQGGKFFTSVDKTRRCDFRQPRKHDHTMRDTIFPGDPPGRTNLSFRTSLAIIKRQCEYGVRFLNCDRCIDDGIKSSGEQENTAQTLFPQGGHRQIIWPRSAPTETSDMGHSATSDIRFK